MTDQNKRVYKKPNTGFRKYMYVKIYTVLYISTWFELRKQLDLKIQNMFHFFKIFYDSLNL